MQVIELVEEVTRLTNEVRDAQYDKEQKDRRISALEKERDKAIEDYRKLDATYTAVRLKMQNAEQITHKQISELQEAAKKSQEEIVRLKCLLARNGIKYRKVK